MSVENKAAQLGRANEADDASGPIQLSDTTPARLIQSTGNLYWSSNPWVIEIQHASPGAGVAAGPPQVLMSYGGVTTALSSNAENAPLFSRLDVLADEAAAYWTWGYVQKYTF